MGYAGGWSDPQALTLMPPLLFGTGREKRQLKTLTAPTATGWCCWRLTTPRSLDKKGELRERFCVMLRAVQTRLWSRYWTLAAEMRAEG